MTDFGLNRRLSTTLRVIAFVVGFMACIVPQLVHGQGMGLPFQASSGSVQGVSNSPRRGFGAQFTGGHMAGDTVGRSDSVTYIGLMPYMRSNNTMFFGDGRLARGNRGGVAWNFGGGVRQYLPATDQVFGLNAYADFDEMNDVHFEQFGFGAELLGKWWDARANVYNPSGKDSALIGIGSVPNSSVFVDNSITFQSASTSLRVLRGYDAELGFQIPGKIPQKFDVKLFGGGYWYDGGPTDNVAGFRLRAEARPAPFLGLNLQVSDDEVFHTSVAFNAEISFGGMKRGWDIPKNQFHRLTDRIRRNLTMVTAQSTVFATVTDPVNSASGVALNILHVNSDPITPVSGALGSVNNPFETMNAALNASNDHDLIFVHAGSTFDESISIDDTIRVLGEGFIPDPSNPLTGRFVEHTVNVPGIDGDVVLPASPTLDPDGRGPLAPLQIARPELTRVANQDAVILTNNLTSSITEFSGFVLNAPGGRGLFIDRVNSGVIRDNTIYGAAGDGVFLNDVDGVFSFVNTEILNSEAVGLHVQGVRGDIVRAPQITFTSEIPGVSGVDDTVDPRYGQIVVNKTVGASTALAGTRSLLVDNLEAGFLNMTGSSIDDGDSQNGLAGGGIEITDSSGNVTIDNANINGAGITIGSNPDLATGTTTFSNTVRPLTSITNSPGDAVNITSLGDGGRVTFRELDIEGAIQDGLSFNSIAGDVRFIDNVTMDAIGRDGVFFDSTAATGSVTFAGNLAVDAAGRNGITISNNALGSLFDVSGATTIGNGGGTVGSSILIGTPGAKDTTTKDFSTVRFSGPTDINNRGAGTNATVGIEIANADGDITFNGRTGVTNQTGSLAPGVDIQNSDGNIFFENLNISQGENVVGAAAGLQMANNGTVPTPLPDAPGVNIIIENLDVQTNSGIGLRGVDNVGVSIRDGSIDSTGESAVDVNNSGLFAGDPNSSVSRMTFESVSSDTPADLAAGGTGTGILLRDLGQNSIFTVTGGDDPSPGTGGVITGATGAGVALSNAAIVRLAGMDLDDNNVGVNSGTNADVAIAPLLLDNDLRLDINNRLELESTSIRNSTTYAVFGTDILNLDIRNSTILANGTQAGDESAINLNYTDRFDLNLESTTTVDDPGVPFTIVMQNNSFVHEAGTVVSITQQVDAREAHLEFDFFENSVQITAPANAADAFDHGIDLTWDGPMRLNFVGNDFSMDGGSQTAFLIDATSSTDELLFNMDRNNINAFGANSIGLDLTTGSGQSTVGVENNVFDSDAGGGTGLMFDMGRNSDMVVSFNRIVESQGDGTGILFQPIAAPALIEMNGNEIEMASFGTFEEGIIFRSVAGPIFLRGSITNTVTLTNPSIFEGFELPWRVQPADEFRGQILINGIPVP